MRTRGFTLIEFMVSIALFGLVAAGAMTLVTSAARSQAHSARVDVAQSGLRAGLDFITRDVLGAGAGMKSASLTNGLNGTLVLPIALLSTYDNLGTNGSDTLEFYGVDSTSLANVTASVAQGATSVQVDSVASYTGCASSTLGYCPALLTDLSNAVLVNVTGTNTGGTYPLLTVNNTASFPTSAQSYSFPGSYVLKLRHVKYTIGALATVANANSANGYALFMDLNDGSGAQPLAEGVEDMQIAYGIDGLNGHNVDGVIDENGGSANDDEWLFNNLGDTPPATMAGLKVIRITLIAKSTQSEPGLFPARPAAEDHAAGTADNFFRRVQRTEIAVRNYNL